MSRFFRLLRSGLGGEAFPYVWVPEWHKTGHGLHVHFGVGQFVNRSLIEQAWGHGFVHIKLLSDLPVGSGRWEESCVAAGYLAKYIGKELDGDVSGLHRYEVAEGFQPPSQVVFRRTRGGALDAASQLMGRQPTRWWSSDDEEGWQGPPAVWASWD